MKKLALIMMATASLVARLSAPPLHNIITVAATITLTRIMVVAGITMMAITQDAAMATAATQMADPFTEVTRAAGQKFGTGLDHAVVARAATQSKKTGA
jgi:hypothetical protein